MSMRIISVAVVTIEICSVVVTLWPLIFLVVTCDVIVMRYHL